MAGQPQRPADAQEYVWDGLTGGQQVCFRIRAVGDAGTSAWHPDGAPVCATTLAQQAPPAVDLRVKGITLSSGTLVCAARRPRSTSRSPTTGRRRAALRVQWLLDGVPISDASTRRPREPRTDTSTAVVPGVPAGAHELVAVIDPAGQIVELDENNNTGVLSFTAEDCVG